MAVAEIAQGVGAVAQGIGAIASLFGGSEQVQGLTLPSEYELVFLEQFDQNLEQLNQDLVIVDNANQAFQDRVSALEGVLNASIPPAEALTRLRDSSLRIAESLGLGAEELVSNGLLDDSDIEDLNTLKDLENQDFRDPRLESQIRDERARLEQELRRSGAGPATRAQALADFDQRAEERRFSTNLELRSNQSALVSNRVGLKQRLRESNLARTLNSLGALNAQTDLARQGINQAGQLASARFQVASQTVQQRQLLRTASEQAFTNLGQFDFSKRTRRLLEAGEVGPGALNDSVAARARLLLGRDRQRVLDIERQQAIEEGDRNNINSRPRPDAAPRSLAQQIQDDMANQAAARSGVQRINPATGLPYK